MKPFGRVSRQCTSAICALALLVTSFTYALGQETKRALTHQDYDSWHSIQSPQISRNGKFIAYAFMAQDGDSEIVVRNLTSGAEWRAPRGYRPPAPPPDDSIPNVAELIAANARLSRALFTADSRCVVFSIDPTRAELNKAKKAGSSPTQGGSSPTVRDVVTESSSEPSTGNSPTATGSPGYSTQVTQRGTSPTVREGSQGLASRSPKKKEYGSDLVLRNTMTGTERTLSDAVDYTLSKDAKTLVFTVSSKKEETNGIFAVTTQNDAAPVALLAGKGKYLKPTWDEDQTELAFMSDRDDADSKQPRVKVYLWNRNGNASVIEGGAISPTVSEGLDRNHAVTPANAAEVVSTSSPGFRKDFVVSDKANLGFSLDGSHLFLGAAPPPEPEKNPDEGIPADEKVLVDLWHWKDDYVQPIQKVRAEQERNRSYRAVFLVKDKKFVQLADEAMESVSPSNDGRYAIGADNRGYRIMSDYDPGLSDYYLLNTTDGTRKLVGQKQRFGASLSPGAKYSIFFDGKDWNSYSSADGRTVNLTKNLTVHFFNEENDEPSTPSSYGLAGWTKDDREVLLYDRYDVWQVSPDGGNAKNLTDGVGRRDKIVFRYVRLDPKERSIDPAKSLLLHVENEETRASGFYRDRVNSGLPEKLLMGAKDFNNPTKT